MGAGHGSRGLSYLQVILLILGFSLASLFIFLFGYAVGQEMALRHTLQSERLVRGTIAGKPATPAPTAAVDAEFYKSLQERAEKQIEAAEAKATPAAAIATATPPVAPTGTPAAARPTATPARTQTAKPTATPRKPTPTRPAQPTRASTPSTSTSIVGESRYSIQVISTRNAQEAIAVTLELRRQGYQAFTAQAPQNGETSYRVRVGRFASRDEAEAVARRLQQDPRFGGASIITQ